MEIRDRVKELRRVRAGDLIAHPENWREHPASQRSALRAVIEEVGFAGAALAYEDKQGVHLIDGHERQTLDPEFEMPVLILDVTEDEAKVLLASLDPIGAMAERNTTKLRGLVEGIQTNTQATRDLLDRIARPKGPRKRQVDIDSLPDSAPVPTAQTGDVWQLGDHRVVCGESFDPDTITALIGGEDKVQMVLTDPPYAIYGSSTGVSSDIADDGMVVPFFVAMFRVIQERLEWFGHAYVHCDWRSWSAIWQAAKLAQVTPKNLIVWDKQSAGLGSSYANTHEFVGLFTKMPPEAAVMTVKRVGQRQVHRPNLIHEAEAAEPDWIRNLVQADRVRGEERLHNAAKPVGLLMEFIQNSSDPGDGVLDLFGGSGSTLMAAEETGRHAFIAERIPRMVDVIVARWERVTERKAEKL